MKRSGLSLAATEKTRIEQILTILHKWGIHTLGQLAVLDKEELRARLGTEAVRMWERANSISTRLLKFVQPPKSFEESFEFENEIETAEPLLFMLRRFLDQLALRLSAIYLVAQELTLRITFGNKQTYERIFQIPQPTNDADLLFRMLHTHLENFKSKYPITGVLLEAQPTKPPEQQFGFFEVTLRNPHQLSKTLARLTALLGTDRVGIPVLEDTHRPDAFRMEPFVWNSRGTTSVSSYYSPDATERIPPISINAPLSAALRRFRPSISALVLLADEQPIHLRSAQISSAIARQSGPYRASGNWWDEKSWARAEWDLQLDNGVVVRCHEGPPSPTSGVAGEGIWEIDGIYD
jgi:protein ImuB